MRPRAALTIMLMFVGCGGPTEPASDPGEATTVEPPAPPAVPDIQCAPESTAPEARSEPAYLGRWIGQARFHYGLATPEDWVEGSHLTIEPIGTDSLRIVIGHSGDFNNVFVRFYCGPNGFGSTWIRCDDTSIFGWGIDFVFSASTAEGHAFVLLSSWGGVKSKSVVGTWCRYGYSAP